MLLLVDMSDAVVWLMEYLQDEARDRETDGKHAAEEGSALHVCKYMYCTVCRCFLPSCAMSSLVQTPPLTCALSLLVRTCVEC